MLARLKSIIRQTILVGPWLLILIVMSLALLTPSMLQNLLGNIAQASIISRVALIGIIYGVLGLILYRRYPQYFVRFLPKQTQTEATAKAPAEKIPRPSTAERATALFNRDNKPAEVAIPEAPPKAVTTTTEEPPKKSPEKAPESSTRDMSEDEFYSFLESVSEDTQKGES